MFFGLLRRKKDKGHDIKQYSVDISTNFNDQDREYYKPIFTIKYYSKLNPSVINEAIFSKNIENGDLTLNHAFLTLEEILKDAMENKLLIDILINQECILTNEEELAFKRLVDKVKFY